MIKITPCCTLKQFSSVADIKNKFQEVFFLRLRNSIVNLKNYLRSITLYICSDITESLENVDIWMKISIKVLIIKKNLQTHNYN